MKSILLGWCCAVLPVAAQDLELQLNLFEAVTTTHQQVAGGPTLILELARRGGLWERVWGEAPRFNKGLAQGLVLDSRLADERLALTIAVNLPSDPWVKGGRARYEITLRRDGPNRFAGTYRGRFRDVPVEGRAEAVVRPPAEQFGAPVAADEHPRLLFRRSELPALREKLRTPLGEAALARLDGVIGAALKYQLTGDAHYATNIIPAVEKLIADTGVGDKLVRGRVLGWRFEQLALAYDLCYDAWPESLKRKIERLVTGHQGWRAFTKPWTFQKEIQWVATNPYPGPIRYGPALAALAIWGLRGPPPARPATPYFLAHPDAVVPAGPAVAGWPVTKFASDTMPGDWVYRVEADGALRALSRQKDKGYYEGKIDITNAAERRYGATAWFYTVIENDAPRWVRIAIGHGGCRLSLNGHRLGEGEVVKLDKGFYALELTAPVGETSSWGRELVQPKLIEEPQPETRLAALREEHEAALRDWEFDLAQHQRLGGADIEAVKIFEVSRYFLAQYLREALGDGGYRVAPLGSLEGPNKYAVAYRNVFGADLTPGPARFLPCQIYTGNPRAFVASRIYNEPEYDLAAIHFGVLYPLVAAQWRPAVFAAWQRLAPDPLAQPKRPTIGFPYESHVAWTLVNHPIAAPVGTTEWPATWRDEAQGWYAFRSPTGDAVVEIRLRRGPGGGEGAGGFRIRAWERDWTPASEAVRLFENVVQLPADIINADGRARLLDYDAAGQVVLELDDVYAAPSRELYERFGSVRVPARLVPSGIRGRRAIAVDYSGRSGVPVLVVVADKVSGAKQTLWSWPTEYARVVLGSVRAWAPEGKPYEAFTQAELRELAGKVGEPKPKKKGAPGDEADDEESLAGQDETAVCDGASFSVRKGEATLRGTLVIPAGSGWRDEALEQFQLGAKHTLVRHRSRGVVASGNGEFLVVLTLGREAPPVTVEGETVRVGGRQILWDGERIRLR